MGEHRRMGLWSGRGQAGGAEGNVRLAYGAGGKEAAGGPNPKPASLACADLHRPVGLKVRDFLGSGQPEANILRVAALGFRPAYGARGKEVAASGQRG